MDGKSSHGGYCGPAVKPIALNMVQQVMSDPMAALPMSGIGGIGSWQDAAEFMLLGAGTVQVCTAAMHYGYRIVEDMGDGLLAWMRRKGYETIDDFRGLSLPNMRDWKHLNLNYRVVAEIHADKCIGCQLCYTACWDGAHQCIHLDRVDGGMEQAVKGTDPRYAQHEPNPHGKPTPAMVFAESVKTIADDADSEAGSGWRGIEQRGDAAAREFRGWMWTSAWGAICARWFVRCRSASRWSAWIRGCVRRRGRSAWRMRRV